MCVKLHNHLINKGDYMKLIQSVCLMAVSLSLVSCGTFEGMGKDLQSLGKTIEKSAAPSTKIEEVKPVQEPSGAVVTPIK
jgi:predicted small secreted protein